jgi:hypothetical protein
MSDAGFAQQAELPVFRVVERDGELIAVGRELGRIGLQGPQLELLNRHDIVMPKLPKLVGHQVGSLFAVHADGSTILLSSMYSIMLHDDGTKFSVARPVQERSRHGKWLNEKHVVGLGVEYEPRADD